MAADDALDGATDDGDAWDRRYDREDYLFGVEPNAFLAANVAAIPAGGRVLAVSDGEGRNGSWLATRGFAVTAFDASAVATEKARALDRERGVAVDRHVLPLDRWEWGAERWDGVVAIFVQFAPPHLRAAMFAGIRTSLRGGGTLLLIGYTPRQLAYGTGGPPHVEHMYTPALLDEAFGDWTPAVREYDDDVREGVGHHGRSALIELVATKPDGPG